MEEIDVAVIGAGAAGVAAGRRLAATPLSFHLFEARARLGGRAFTTMAAGFPVDLGCGWLHSAEANPWTRIAEDLGLAVDRNDPPWMKPAFDPRISPEDQADYRRAFFAMDERIVEAARAGQDRPASELLPPGGRWNGRLNAFSGYYNGAAFDDISVKDYAAFDDSGADWRIREGYGRAVADWGAGLAVSLESPVARIDRSGARLRIETPRGAVSARTAIIAVPTAVLAAERLRFDPPLPAKAAAAADLPLGHVDKVFLSLAEGIDLPVEVSVAGRYDSARTGSYHLRPFGRPMIEGFFGGDLARDLEAEGPQAFAAFAIDELAQALGSAARAKLSFLAASAWAADPWSGGAYSHARPHRAGARAVLAEPVEDRLFFAGEAVSAADFSTAHGAWRTGTAAAEAAIRALAS